MWGSSSKFTHISKGWYNECFDCGKRQACQEYGVQVGEQSEL